MNSKLFKATAGDLLAPQVPTCQLNDPARAVLDLLASEVWDDIHFVYVVDVNKKPIGQIQISQLVQASPNTTARKLMQPLPEVLSPQTDQIRIVHTALKHDVNAVPVVASDGHLLGAITGKTLIDILHHRHVQSLLQRSGIRRKNTDIVKLATAPIGHVLVRRAPWLIVGALVGVGLGFISSQFEASLEKSIAIAYFIPVVAYIADSVGTQSEAITIRALAMVKLRYLTYLSREVVIGFSLGLLLGGLGALGALLVSQSPEIAFVVGLSLLTASTLATSLAAFIPIGFKLLGKDPALGSGPLATAIQDIVSVVIYFLFALWLI